MRWRTPVLLALATGAVVGPDCMSPVLQVEASTLELPRVALAAASNSVASKPVEPKAAEPTEDDDEGGPASDEWGEIAEDFAIEESDSEADGPSPTDSAASPASTERPVVVSLARETWVFAKPRWDSRRLGYLRAGATVDRDPKPTSFQRCRRGWLSWPSLF